MDYRNRNAKKHIKGEKEMRRINKTAAILMLTAFIFATAMPAMAGGFAKITDIAGGNGGGTNAASTIYFGNYWQSAVSGYTPTGTCSEPEAFNKNHYNKEGIKWRVLSNADGKTLLLSDQGLYTEQFNNDETAENANVWNTSKIRTTMNNTTATTFKSDGTVNAWGGFAGDAFSAAELAAIAETKHTAGGTETGHNIESTDKLFLLSVEEARNTAYGFENTETEVPSATRKFSAAEMAQHATIYGNYEAALVEESSCCWRLRSPSTYDEEEGYQAYAVAYDGSINDKIPVNYGFLVALSAFNLNRDNVLFLSAATGGKSAVKLGGGFALEDYNGANGWKLTLKDTNIPTPKITNVETKDNKLQVTYSGVTTGKNMYLSALLYNETGELINYAKVAEKSEDTAEISLDGIEGKYKVRFFTEQANGDKQTDYASELSEEYEITAEKPKSSSGGGCNAGFGALALLALAGLALRKRKSKFRR